MSEQLARRWRSLAIIGGGLAVPAVATLVVPIFQPERQVGVPQQLVLVAWTVWPFVLLGSVGHILLHRAGSSPNRQTRQGVGLACALLLASAVEFVIYLPQPSYGMNFGIPFIPLYAAVLMPVGWAVGWTSARLLT